MLQAAISAELVNAIGLHARPSVRLTQLAKTFRAHIEMALDAGGPWIDAKSPVGVMRLKAPMGTVLYLRADGNDADKALEALAGLIARKFDES